MNQLEIKIQFISIKELFNKSINIFPERNKFIYYLLNFHLFYLIEYQVITNINLNR